MDNITFFDSIDLAALPEAVRTELEELHKDTNGFSDLDIVEIEQENIDELFKIVRDRYPDSLNTKTPAPKKKSAKFVKTGAKKVKESNSLVSDPIKKFNSIIKSIKPADVQYYHILINDGGKQIALRWEIKNGNHIPVFFYPEGNFASSSAMSGPELTPKQEADLYDQVEKGFVQIEKKPKSKYDHLKREVLLTLSTSKVKVNKVKTSKPSKNVQTGKGVEEISREVYFVKRALSMHNKAKPAKSLLSLVKSLQRAIVTKAIRKTSPIAQSVQLLQERLVKAYNITIDKKLSEVQIVFKDSDLAQFVDAVGGEKVFDSIKLIKRFIAMQGKPFETKSIEAFTKQLEKVSDDDPYQDKTVRIAKVLKNGKPGDVIGLSTAELSGLKGLFGAGLGCIDDTTAVDSKGRPASLKLQYTYNNHIIRIYTYPDEGYYFKILTLTNGFLMSDTGPYKVNFERISKIAEGAVDTLVKDGLPRALKSEKKSSLACPDCRGTCKSANLGCTCGAHVKNEVQTGLSGIDDNDFVRADQRNQVKAPGTFQLPGEMGVFLGELQPYKLSIVITGDPHAGKTEFVTQLINSFVEGGKEVGLFSIEQGGLESKDTRAAIDRNVSPENQKHVSVSGGAKKGLQSIKEAARKFDVVVVDSWQKLGEPSTKFDSLRHEFPNTIWVVIFQQNGEGGTRGGVSADYDSPVLLKVHKVDNTFENNFVEAKKNRGNSLLKTYNIKRKAAMTPQDSE